jgi:hypothetical protein
MSRYDTTSATPSGVGSNRPFVMMEYLRDDAHAALVTTAHTAAVAAAALSALNSIDVLRNRCVRANAIPVHLANEFRLREEQRRLRVGSAPPRTPQSLCDPHTKQTHSAPHTQKNRHKHTHNHIHTHTYTNTDTDTQTHTCTHRCRPLHQLERAGQERLTLSKRGQHPCLPTFVHIHLRMRTRITEHRHRRQLQSLLIRYTHEHSAKNNARRTSRKFRSRTITPFVVNRSTAREISTAAPKQCTRHHDTMLCSCSAGMASSYYSKRAYSCCRQPHPSIHTPGSGGRQSHTGAPRPGSSTHTVCLVPHEHESGGGGARSPPTHLAVTRRHLRRMDRRVRVVIVRPGARGTIEVLHGRGRLSSAGINNTSAAHTCMHTRTN